jgi:hypothetical protein
LPAPVLRLGPILQMRRDHYEFLLRQIRNIQVNQKSRPSSSAHLSIKLLSDHPGPRSYAFLARSEALLLLVPVVGLKLERS